MFYIYWILLENDTLKQSLQTSETIVNAMKQPCMIDILVFYLIPPNVSLKMLLGH